MAAEGGGAACGAAAGSPAFDMPNWALILAKHVPHAMHQCGCKLSNCCKERDGAEGFNKQGSGRESATRRHLILVDVGCRNLAGLSPQHPLESYNMAAAGIPPAVHTTLSGAQLGAQPASRRERRRQLTGWITTKVPAMHNPRLAGNWDGPSLLPPAAAASHCRCRHVSTRRAAPTPSSCATPSRWTATRGWRWG